MVFAIYRGMLDSAERTYSEVQKGIIMKVFGHVGNESFFIASVVSADIMEMVWNWACKDGEIERVSLHLPNQFGDMECVCNIVPYMMNG